MNLVPIKTIQNRLLGLYDQNNNTKEYVYCDITYKKGSQTHTVEDAGVTTSRMSSRRPEGTLKVLKPN